MQNIELLKTSNIHITEAKGYLYVKIKDTIFNWVALNKPNDYGKYQVCFILPSEDDKILFETLSAWFKTQSNKPASHFCGRKELPDHKDIYLWKATKNEKNKEGEISKAPKVFDKYNKLMETVPSVKNGAVGNIAFIVRVSETSAKKLGLSAHLDRVQLLSFDEYLSGNASGFEEFGNFEVPDSLDAEGIDF